MWHVFRRSRRDECSRTRELLSGYIDQRLSLEEAARVEEHLGMCEGCRGELESLRTTVALLRHLPEVTPLRSFALAPVKPLPGHRALPALRFATAAAVLLLVVAFAVDGVGLFEGGMLSNLQSGSGARDFDANGMSEEGESYWVVWGEKNTVDTESQTSVELVVPDDTDNVQVAVNSLALANNGVLYGDLVGSSEVPQIALMEGEEGNVRAGEVEEFTVVTASDADQSPFATNSNEAHSAFYTIMKEQTGPYLNMVPSSSDNNVLYSFYLGAAKKEVVAAQGNEWLRPLEYGLIGLVAMLAGATAALWLTQRRARITEVSDNKN